MNPASDPYPDRAWERVYAAGVNAADEDPRLPAALRPAGEGRAASDAAAAWRRWHAPLTTQEHETSQLWHGVLERARVETLAAHDLPGMAHNLGDIDALVPLYEPHARLYRAARALFAGQDWHDALLPPRPPGSRQLFARLRTWAGRAAPIPEMNDEQAIQQLRTAATCLHDAPRFAALVQPLVSWLAQWGPEPALPVAKGPSPRRAGETGEETGAEQDMDTTVSGGASPAPLRTTVPGYAVYTRQWDEEAPAERYLGDAEPLELALPEQARFARLARQLQRRLQVARRRSWDFDLDAGRLDPRRLARLLGPRHNGAVFRAEREAPMAEACVVLLVDQSASMRRERRQLAALAIDLAVHVLESCRISVEVLGYTTTQGADNPVARQWRADGSPAAPGRLNASRHIIYKAAHQPWRHRRAGLALLLQEGFGHENLDGEALDWAARRLAARPEAHKRLLVLSDGAPWDEATVAANSAEYLVDHLRRVIASIEASPIHLAAIGTGQEVGRFYRRAVTLRRPTEIADVLFEQLARLLGADTREATP